MSAGGARRGRRDNGLDAAEWAVAGDVDPRVGEHLLDVLGAGGIAAYLQPAADLNPITRTTTVPSRPTDRLYVDRAHLDTAKEYLDRLAADEKRAGDEAQPEEGPPARERAAPAPDMDAEWRRIVAAYDNGPDDPGSPPWPEEENVTHRPGTTPAEPPSPSRFRSSSLRDASSLLDGLDTFGADLPDEPDEGYSPPPPPPLPRLSKHAVAGVLLVVAGFVLFLVPDLLPVDPDLALFIGLAGVLGGFATLIWRLRANDDSEPSGPDDGAVV